MPNPGAFKGSRLKFLTSHLEGYRKACDEGVEDEFLLNLLRVYHHLFPEEMSPDVERSDEEMSAVNPDEIEDPVFVPPVQKAGQSDADLDAEKKAYEELKKRYAFRRNQIICWLNYRRLSRDTSKKQPDAVDKLVGRLSGISSASRRRQPAFTVWARAHPEIVEPLIQKRIEELEAEVARAKGGSKVGGQDDANNVGNANGTAGDSSELEIIGEGDNTAGGSKIKRKKKYDKKGKAAYVAVRQDVVKHTFDKLPAEERKQWAETARNEASAREAAYHNALTSPPPTDPASRQSAIERLPSTMQPVLDGLAAATGWCFTLLAGGPEPADGGRLNIISTHSGTIAGPRPLNFGTAYRTNYKRFFIPLFATFLQRVYTVDECRRRALPEGSPSLSSIIDEEADGVLHDTIVLTPKLPHGAVIAPATGALPSAGPSSSNPLASRINVNALLRPAANNSTTTPQGSLVRTGNSSTVPHVAASSTKPTPQTKVTAPTVTSTANSTPHSSVMAQVPKRQGFTSVMRMSTGGKPPRKPTNVAATGTAAPEQPAVSSSLGRENSTSARSRLAGSERNYVNSTIAQRPRSSSCPPSPGREQHSSPVSTKATPPRATRSPAVLSPITIPSSPPAQTHSGRKESPIEVNSSQPSRGLVIRTYKSPRRKDKQKAVPNPSVSDEEMDGDFTQQDGYEPDSAFFDPPQGSSKRRCNQDSEDDSAQPKRQRGNPVASAPVPSSTSLQSDSISEHGVRRSRKKPTGAYATAPPPPPPPPPSPSASVFDVPTPPNAPDYVIRTLELARVVGIDEDFRRMLRLYLRIDSATDFAGTGRLPTSGRPAGIGAWIARACSPRYRPNTSDLARYYDECFEWFKECMPEWRKDQKKGFRLTRDPNGNWEPLRQTGRNGIVSFIPMLAWWKEALTNLPVDTLRQRQTKDLRQAEFDGALHEVIYCFEGLVRDM
ncbi:SERTA domain-containing protein 3 [Paramarasmius palmivorus]|uniref:SERTA domain-containing protein 3 n=1 Tax=Paramarasmius palmivorus TaxID=297713 RepID=A0AAW0BCI5_9AGAR